MNRVLSICWMGVRWLLIAGSVLTVLLWITSRIITDSVWWMQYVWWAPTIAWIALAAVLLPAWWGADALHARLRKNDEPRPGHRGWVRRGVTVLAGLMILHALVFEWRVHRFVLPHHTPAHRGVRIANWNPAVPVDTLLGPVVDLDAEIIAIVNQPGAGDVDELVAALGEGWRTVESDRFSIVTRLPIKRWAMTRLGLEGRVMNSYRFAELDVRMTEQYDEGRALFIELETPHGPLTLWVVDLPSDITLPRADVMATAADVLAGFEGRIYRYEGDERVVERIEGGFPQPDVIVGDFNTPRGSRSLRRLVGDRVNAYDAAGRGWSATFPRTMPVIQIDQMFVSRDWTVAEYRIFDPEGGFHLAQIGEITPRD